MVPTLGGLFFVVYVACVIGIIIYVLKLLGQFVQAQQRVAGALETIARKLGEGTKPEPR